MVSVQNMWKCSVASLIVGATMLTPVALASPQDNGKREDGQGKYSQLTAQWWQWILEQPATGNPNLDSTGQDAANDQPREDVFLLAGTFGDPVVRQFTVPAGEALFLPLLNTVAFSVPTPPGPKPKESQNQVPQLRTLLAAPSIDSVSELHVTLDDGSGPVSLLAFVSRIKSPVFRFTLPDEDNIFQAFGVDITGTFKGVSDGYWLFIPPLPPGVYTLDFGGTSDDLTVDVTDLITVS